jgi:hypothetical protein
MTGAASAMLPAGWQDRPDLVQAGLAVTGLHSRALAWAYQHRTDGWIPGELALEYCAGDEAPIMRAVELGLWVHEIRDDQPGFHLPDHVASPTSAERDVADARVRARQAAGRVRTKRWRERVKHAEQPVDNPAGDAVAVTRDASQASPQASHPPSPAASHPPTPPPGFDPTPLGSGRVETPHRTTATRARVHTRTGNSPPAAAPSDVTRSAAVRHARSAAGLAARHWTDAACVDAVARLLAARPIDVEHAWAALRWLAAQPDTRVPGRLTAPGQADRALTALTRASSGHQTSLLLPITSPPADSRTHVRTDDEETRTA